MAKPRAIPKETITRAVNSLLKWLHSKRNSKQNLKDDTFIYLVLTLKKIPHRGRHLSVPLPIPHPLHSPISLLFDDRGPHSPLAAGDDAIRSLSLPVDNLIPFSEVRARGEIPCGLLLADRRIVKLLPEKKGGGGRVVEVVDMGKKWWPEAVRRSVGTTVMSFRGGTCCGIRVGRPGMAADEIAENVAAAVEGAVENVPKKWGNVRGFHLKAAESVALPIYDAAAAEEAADGGKMKRAGEVREQETGREAKRRKVGA